MVLSELLDSLRAAGIDAKAHQIHHGIQAGYLPRPRVSGGRFDFRPGDVKAAKKYLVNVPRPGRRKQEAAS